MICVVLLNVFFLLENGMTSVDSVQFLMERSDFVLQKVELLLNVVMQTLDFLALDINQILYFCNNCLSTFSSPEITSIVTSSCRFSSPSLLILLSFYYYIIIIILSYCFFSLFFQGFCLVATHYVLIIYIITSY